MATLCRNCSGPLRFDPLRRCVICTICGSAFAAESVEAYGKQYEEEREESATLDPATGLPGESSGAVKEYLECHVYTCNTCGGEIILNGAEVATTCIYCGGPSVAFNRISKERRPDFVIPFTFPKEQAVQILQQKFRSGPFIPDEFKRISTDMIRGIYIPYWIVDVLHSESDILSCRESHNNSTHTYYYARAATMKLETFPVEASTLLNDESSSRLAPYDFHYLKAFDEDYLLGFYANMSDITFGDLRNTVNKHATHVFKWKIGQTIPGVGMKNVVESKTADLIDKNLKLALLPAWFVTVMYQGQPHTILVNGQTGKIVCGLPWSKKKFWTLTWLVAAALALIPTILATVLAYAFTFDGGYPTIGLLSGMLPTAIPFLSVSAIFFLIGLICYRRVTNQIGRTKDEATFTFVNKRQG